MLSVNTWPQVNQAENLLISDSVSSAFCSRSFSAYLGSSSSSSCNSWMRRSNNISSSRSSIKLDVDHYRTDCGMFTSICSPCESGESK